MATSQKRPGAVRLGGDDDRKKGGGWWKWLLAALLIAALIALLVALLGGDDEKSSSSSKSGGAAAGASAGSLTAGGTELLPVPSDGLQSYVGQDATGKSVEVQSVIDGEGFFVGTSQTDRVYVEYGGKTGENEANAFRPDVGDKVDLTGPVRPSPQDPASALRLDADDAKVVKDNGGFINADEVSRVN